MAMRLGRVLGTLAGFGLGIFGLGEVIHLYSHRSDYGTARETAGKNQLIVVLGCPANFDGSPADMQIWRTKIAVRTIDPEAASTTLVFTGADTRRKNSEAAVMAQIARDFGVPDSQIVLEEHATSTWENIAYTIDLMEAADVIQIVSTPMHARRARWYLLRQRPDLTEKLAPADDYHFGEHPLMKVSAAFYETVGAYREWRRPRLPDVAPRQV